MRLPKSSAVAPNSRVGRQRRPILSSTPSAISSARRTFVRSPHFAASSQTTSPGGVLKKYKIAVIEGDGIGREVVPEGIRVLEAAGRRFDIGVAWTHFDWSCDRYLKTGKMMPEDGLDQLRAFDAIYLGAIGSPKVADHISLWGLLIPIRRTFQQYVNLRPARLLP